MITNDLKSIVSANAETGEFNGKNNAGS